MFNNSTRIPRISRIRLSHSPLHFPRPDQLRRSKIREIRVQIKNNHLCENEKGQDEQVPVHDGVSLSAAVSLGCHRNTPDCTLPCLQMAIPCFLNHYLLFRNLYRSRFQHRFRYHHLLEGCYHRLEWYLQAYHHRMDSWSCCSLLHPHA